MRGGHRSIQASRVDAAIRLTSLSLFSAHRHGVRPRLTCSESVKTKVQRAAEVIQDALNHTGGSLYGVTTGVGASGRCDCLEGVVTDDR